MMMPCCCIISLLYIKPQHHKVVHHFQCVVLYRFSTSNHNLRGAVELTQRLYYIVSLHQITTYHILTLCGLSCIISFLYIKPQLGRRSAKYLSVVLYRFSTSNHNLPIKLVIKVLLYYIVSLHQTTTIICFLRLESTLYYIVSLHQTTTHIMYFIRFTRLYYIVSLHQTTTNSVKFGNDAKLYYIVSLHQTTTMGHDTNSGGCCIISFLYIKPQLSVWSFK